MRDIEFLKLIEDSRLAVFTPKDVSRVIGKHADYVYTYLNRLTKRELIGRIEHGKYTLLETSIESVATNLHYPSYISFLTAYYYHKRTQQIPREISVVTAQSKRTMDFRGYKIRFIRFKPDRITGYERMQNGNIWYLGDLEKSIVDSLYIPENCSIADSAIALRDGVNHDKVVDYCKRTGSAVTMKRAGFLLELQGIDVHDSFESYLNMKYDALDPQLPKRGTKNKKWHLIVNTEVEYAY
jgi:predicted transcriptional regulator of viral defense system